MKFNVRNNILYIDEKIIIESKYEGRLKDLLLCVDKKDEECNFDEDILFFSIMLEYFNSGILFRYPIYSEEEWKFKCDYWLLEQEKYEVGTKGGKLSEGRALLGQQDFIDYFRVTFSGCKKDEILARSGNSHQVVNEWKDYQKFGFTVWQPLVRGIIIEVPQGFSNNTLWSLSNEDLRCERYGRAKTLECMMRDNIAFFSKNPKKNKLFLDKWINKFISKEKRNMNIENAFYKQFDNK